MVVALDVEVAHRSDFPFLVLLLRALIIDSNAGTNHKWNPDLDDGDGGLDCVAWKAAEFYIMGVENCQPQGR